MARIALISSSIRNGRKSHRVSLYLQEKLQKDHGVEVIMLDLLEYEFPLFPERLKNLEKPDRKVTEFADQVKNADGILIVTPEYNGALPASLKNVIDLLFEEWKRKPIAISTVSSGAFGGSQVITSLVFMLWKIGAWMVPAMFPVPHIAEAFDEEGKPSDEAGTGKRAARFLEELMDMVKKSKA